MKRTVDAKGMVGVVYLRLKTTTNGGRMRSSYFEMYFVGQSQAETMRRLGLLNS